MRLALFFPDYSDNMTIADILNYIQLNRYQIQLYQLGAIIGKLIKLILNIIKKNLQNSV